MTTRSEDSFHATVLGHKVATIHTSALKCWVRNGQCQEYHHGGWFTVKNDQHLQDEGVSKVDLKTQFDTNSERIKKNNACQYRHLSNSKGLGSGLNIPSSYYMKRVGLLMRYPMILWKLYSLWIATSIRAIWCPCSITHDNTTMVEKLNQYLSIHPSI